MPARQVIVILNTYRSDRRFDVTVGEPVPVMAIASCDMALRGAAVATMRCALPRAVVVQHDVLGGGELCDLPAAPGRSRLRPRADPLRPRSSCRGRFPAVGVEPRAAMRSHANGPIRSVVPRTVAARVICALDGDCLLPDLFGDDLLQDRGLATSADDQTALPPAVARARVEEPARLGP